MMSILLEKKNKQDCTLQELEFSLPITALSVTVIFILRQSTICMIESSISFCMFGTLCVRGSLFSNLEFSVGIFHEASEVIIRHRLKLCTLYENQHPPLLYLH